KYFCTIRFVRSRVLVTHIFLLQAGHVHKAIVIVVTSGVVKRTFNVSGTCRRPIGGSTMMKACSSVSRLQHRWRLPSAIAVLTIVLAACTATTPAPAPQPAVGVQSGSSTQGPAGTLRDIRSQGGP